MISIVLLKLPFLFADTEKAVGSAWHKIDTKNTNVTVCRTTQEGHKRDTSATQEGHKRDTSATHLGHKW